MCETHKGYGRWGNAAVRVQMKELDYKGKCALVKELWEEDPVKYNQWKEDCIEGNSFPEFFGTRDNPIPIDESKL